MGHGVRQTAHKLLLGWMVLTLFSLIVALSAHQVYAADKVRFAVGPFQPTPGDTKKAYEPFFQHLAKAMGVEYDLVVTTDWAGIATALANGQADVAWMGPWGYVLANKEGDAQAIATVKYDGKPFYHAIIVGRPDLKISNWPDDAKGLSISFADRGSTSGWLVPTYWFKTKGIDPKTFFKYREGASHPANETAVANGQVDLATDYDPQSEQHDRTQFDCEGLRQSDLDLGPSAQRCARCPPGL